MIDLLRRSLMRLPPEQAHHATLRLLQLSGALGGPSSIPENDPVELFGLRFPNRVGLAAGYDKDGLGWHGLARLGFGHIEIGTVTPQPQAGNPPPRLFRLPEDQALINRLGFPSRGADFVAGRLRGPRPPVLVLGVNLGVNRDTAMGQAAEDYMRGMEVFNPLADYLVINVSSPNTPGLRSLQFGRALIELLASLAPLREKPLLVKLAPDLDDYQLKHSLDAITEAAIDGVIATNTTLQRPPLNSANRDEAGGLSGAPLTHPSLAMVRRIRQLSGGQLPVIAAGGIMSATDARAALAAGATLVQVYTGLVYRGPRLVREILSNKSP
jgi:dihydroorotate dehydrogenase